MTEEVKEWWELTARWFQDDIDLDVGVNWTGMSADNDLRLLLDVAGKDVLELGCGGGQCSVALAERGANVTGIDLSTEQLAFARDLSDERDTDVAFRQGDVTDLGMFDDDSFDVAFNAYVFQWVEDLAACFREAHRVLRSGGRFVFSMPHPVYGLADPESHEIEESYFDTGRQVTPQDDLDVDMVTYRHSVADVHNALVGAGFRVERMLEPGSADPDDYEEGPWGEHRPELLAKLPSTLIFEGRAA
ncbi:methyltransferase domain-containing protein [Halosimplex rubrum]|uniref:Methyltransferase domain-containing protein n=1 Tax=Halosimplex rubrum TaxID=869889 RepID=A0A7D5T4A2_9EURY|nr:class I SAM-dependent methyltransferase [Halosimplex rubrum]QLH76729.1 methyltransferase domain-containing protein [Halosimplex rubrum]